MEPTPSSVQPAPYDSWLVGVVRVVVHNLGPVKPGANISYNHWTLSLLVARDAQDLAARKFSVSVRLDLRPEGPENGTLHIDFLDYLLSRNAAKHFDFTVSHSEGQVTVRAVKDLLRARGRDRYTML